MRIKQITNIANGLYLFGLFFVPVIVTAGPKEEFAALETQLLKAQEEFQKDPASGGKSDPRLAILNKMDALGMTTADKSAGTFIAIWAFNYSWQLDLDLPNLFARFERIVRSDLNDPSLGDAILVIPDAYKKSPAAPRWIDLLSRIVETTTRESTRLDALSVLGQVQLREEMFSQARATFERLLKAAGTDREFSRLAKAHIFEIDHLQMDMTAPDFSFKTLDGKEFKLSSLRGKVVLLNFWATWCAPCVAKIPELKGIAARLKDRGLGEKFEILNISLDDFREVLDGVVQSQSIPGIQAWDPAGRDNPIAEMYNVQKLPVWFVIDDKGVIRGKSYTGNDLSGSVEVGLKSLAGSK